MNVRIMTLSITTSCFITSSDQHIGKMEQCALKNVNNCLYTNIYSYLETSGGQSFNIYLNVHFFNTSAHKTSVAAYGSCFSCVYLQMCAVLLRDTAKHLHYNTFFTVMLIFVMLSVIMLNVVMLKVVAPLARL
jgi:hypothetical protein